MNRHVDVPFYSQKVNFQNEDSEFPNEAEVTRWEANCCGVACMRMAVDHLTGKRVSYWQMLQLGLAINGYTEAGWIHHKLLELGETFGLTGRTHRRKKFEDVVECTRAGSICIVSVTVCFWGGLRNSRTGDVFQRGGHLVIAYQNSDGLLAVNHPATYLESNKKNWVVSREEWERSMSGNFIEFYYNGIEGVEPVR